LKLSYRAAKEADWKCKIILAGVAMSDTDFLRRFYQHGGKDHFDIMALHPYSSPAAPEDEAGSLFFGQALKKQGAALLELTGSPQYLWLADGDFATIRLYRE